MLRSMWQGRIHTFSTDVEGCRYSKAYWLLLEFIGLTYKQQLPHVTTYQLNWLLHQAIDSTT